jgi:hypothetical protein
LDQEWTTYCTILALSVHDGWRLFSTDRLVNCTPGYGSKMEIYHALDDGRIVEYRIGQHSDNGEAVWARNLTVGEKEAYWALRRLGRTDMEIFESLNHTLGNQSHAGN